MIYRFQMIVFAADLRLIQMNALTLNLEPGWEGVK